MAADQTAPGFWAASKFEYAPQIAKVTAAVCERTTGGAGRLIAPMVGSRSIAKGNRRKRISTDRYDSPAARIDHGEIDRGRRRAFPESIPGCLRIDGPSDNPAGPLAQRVLLWEAALPAPDDILTAYFACAFSCEARPIGL